MAKTKLDEAETPLTFESAMTQLEQIVRKLESNSTGLEASLEQYACAVEYIKFCHEKLDGARRRIAQLQGVREDGRAVTIAWDDTATDMQERSDASPKRRS